MWRCGCLGRWSWKCGSYQNMNICLPGVTCRKPPQAELPSWPSNTSHTSKNLWEWRHPMQTSSTMKWFQQVEHHNDTTTSTTLLCHHLSPPVLSWGHGRSKFPNRCNETCRGSQQRWSKIPMLIWVVVSNIFYFHPESWGNDPIWRAYFSKEPPTSYASLPNCLEVMSHGNWFWPHRNPSCLNQSTWPTSFCNPMNPMFFCRITLPFELPEEAIGKVKYSPGTFLLSLLATIHLRRTWLWVLKHWQHSNMEGTSMVAWRMWRWSNICPNWDWGTVSSQLSRWRTPSALPTQGWLPILKECPNG